MEYKTMTGYYIGQERKGSPKSHAIAPAERNEKQLCNTHEENYIPHHGKGILVCHIHSRIQVVRHGGIS